MSRMLLFAPPVIRDSPRQVEVLCLENLDAVRKFPARSEVDVVRHLL